jgi:hypothetical protein
MNDSVLDPDGVCGTSAAVRTPRRAYWPGFLLLLCAVLLTGLAIRSDQQDVDAPLRHCTATAGLPLHALLAAVLGPAATLLGVGLLLRAPALPAAAGAGVTALLLVVLLPLQGQALKVAVEDRGPQPSPCFGLTAPQVPAVRGG